MITLGSRPLTLVTVYSIGRIKTIALGAIWGIVGAALQTSAQNSNFMICGKDALLSPNRFMLLTQLLARAVNGIGTGILNVRQTTTPCL